MNPKISESTDAIRMAIFEKTMISGSLKAKIVMKMDIVKPIPPSILASICGAILVLLVRVSDDMVKKQ